MGRRKRLYPDVQGNTWNEPYQPNCLIAASSSLVFAFKLFMIYIKSVYTSAVRQHWCSLLRLRKFSQRISKLESTQSWDGLPRLYAQCWDDRTPAEDSITVFFLRLLTWMQKFLKGVNLPKSLQRIYTTWQWERTRRVRRLSAWQICEEKASGSCCCWWLSLSKGMFSGPFRAFTTLVAQKGELVRKILHWTTGWWPAVFRYLW